MIKTCLKSITFLLIFINLYAIQDQGSPENTQNLISEITQPFSEQSVDRHVLLALSENHAMELMSYGLMEEASSILEYISILYDEQNDYEGQTFALARSGFCAGDFDKALAYLYQIPDSSELSTFKKELITQITQAKNHAKIQKQNFPLIASLELMRLKALDELGFYKWTEKEIKSNEPEMNYKTLKAHIIQKGIDEIIIKIAQGAYNNLETAFENFASFTSIKEGYGIENEHDLPWTVIGDQLYYGVKRAITGDLRAMTGDELKDMLIDLEVDVKGFIALSNITDTRKRENWLYEYVKEIRSDRFYFGSYPFVTVINILKALIESKNPYTRNNAKILYDKVSGNRSFSGFSDAEFNTLLKEGTKEAIPMVLAMIVASPAAAMARGITAAAVITESYELVRIGSAAAKSSRLLWAGSKASKAGLLAQSLAFSTEVVVFYVANQVFRKILIGSDIEMSISGVLHTALFLGGLKTVMKFWSKSFGALLKTISEKAPIYKPILGVINSSGVFYAELASFVLLGRLGELLNLAPKQDLSFRQEIFLAGMTLTQLRLAMSAGKLSTKYFGEVEFAKQRLDATEDMLKQNKLRGLIRSEAEFHESLDIISSTRSYLDSIGRLLDPKYQLAYESANAGSSSQNPQNPGSGQVSEMGLVDFVKRNIGLGGTKAQKDQSSDKGNESRTTPQARATIEMLELSSDPVNSNLVITRQSKLSGVDMTGSTLSEASVTIDKTSFGYNIESGHNQAGWVYYRTARGGKNKVNSNTLLEPGTEVQIGGFWFRLPALKSGIRGAQIDGSNGNPKVLDALNRLYPGEEIILGRDMNFGGLDLSKPSVSTQHAKLYRAPDGQLYIMDLGSTNGTFIRTFHSNFSRIRAHQWYPLSAGFEVSFGLVGFTTPARRPNHPLSHRGFPKGSSSDTVYIEKGASPHHPKVIYKNDLGIKFITDSEIKRVNLHREDLTFKHLDMNYGVTLDGKFVIPQLGFRGCVAACASMLAMDYGKGPDMRYWRETNLSNHESAAGILGRLGINTRIIPLEGNNSQRAHNLELLLQQYGSTMLSIGGELGGHMIIIDYFSPSQNTAIIRDPHHGWSITTTAEAITQRGIGDILVVESVL
ncbi:MAG: FHA domain-containing protein [Pseudomonadota bacterium]